MLQAVSRLASSPSGLPPGSPPACCKHASFCCCAWDASATPSLPRRAALKPDGCRPAWPPNAAATVWPRAWKVAGRAVPMALGCSAGHRRVSLAAVARAHAPKGLIAMPRCRAGVGCRPRIRCGAGAARVPAVEPTQGLTSPSVMGLRTCGTVLRVMRVTQTAPAAPSGREGARATARGQQPEGDGGHPEPASASGHARPRHKQNGRKSQGGPAP